MKKTLLSALLFLAGTALLILLPSSSKIMGKPAESVASAAILDVLISQRVSVNELTVSRTDPFMQITEEWYVATSGTDTNNCRSQATPCRTIQAAIDRASDNHRINIAAGTYYENLVIDQPKRLILQGAGAERTIIDGRKETHVLFIGDSGPSIELHDVTVKNGYALWGGGIYNDGELEVYNSIVSENVASYDGGGIFNCGTLVVDGSTISSNRAENGGGINSNGSFSSDRVCDSAQLVVTNSTIAGNGAEQHGGGVLLYAGRNVQTATNNCIIGNWDSWDEAVIHYCEGGCGDFRYNWWGAADGPTRWEYQNGSWVLMGSGDGIRGPQYDPWLTSPPFSCATPKPAIVFVHGWSGLLPGPNGPCSSPDPDTYFGNIDDELKQAGYHVDYARLVTSPCFTPHITDNVPPLKAAIDRAKARTGQQDRVILIAHSMGGLVSRAYIEGAGYENDVSTLFTLGSPHQGAPVAALNFLFGGTTGSLSTFCVLQPGACDFSELGIVFFNRHFSKRANGVRYYLISGDAPSFSRSPLGNIMGMLVPGSDDGIVPTTSGLGLQDVLARWSTDEVHNDALGPQPYFPGDGHLSQSYLEYLEPILVGEPSSTWGSPGLPLLSTESEPVLAQRTPIEYGTVLAGQSVTRTIPLEGGPTFFAVHWQTGTVTVTLVSPLGQPIDPSYATSNPGVVQYEGDGTAATYYFTNTVFGNWQLVLKGSYDIPAEGTSYATFAAFDSNISFTAGVSQLWYMPGSAAVITATLSGSPSSVAMTATILRADGVTETVNLSSSGNGNYQATYPVPDVPGYVEVRMVAVGVSAAGHAFEQGQDLAFQIASDSIALNDSYSDAPQAALSGPPHYEALQVTVGANSSVSGTICLSADLVDAAGHFVAHSFTTGSVITGTNALALSFKGEDIFVSQRNGPYILTNVLLTGYQGATLVIAEAEDVYTTKSYNYQDFGLYAAYLPVVSRNYTSVP